MTNIKLSAEEINMLLGQEGPEENERNTKEEFPAMNHEKENSQPGTLGGTPNVQPVQFSNLDDSAPQLPGSNNLDLLLDIPLQVTVELGRTKKMVKEILDVSPGSIIELDKLAGEPVDILVNNKLIAVGEVVVIDDNFGVRVTDILSPMDRISKLR
jgi:flagellar motor switch protein FliN